MKLVDQWRRLERQLPEGWRDARLLLRLADEEEAARAAALLAPLLPGRSKNEVRFYCTRRGSGAAPDAVRRLLGRVDAAGLEGELSVVSVGEPEDTVTTVERPTFVAAWDRAIAALPPDWSDLYVEVELHSSDYLERAALLLSPVNPARYGGKPGFRFRCARRFGYGGSASMARRCLQRLDEEGIRGSVEVLRALSDTDPVATQGPVWYVGGKAV